jgi:hypothetical protein
VKDLRFSQRYTPEDGNIHNLNPFMPIFTNCPTVLRKEYTILKEVVLISDVNIWHIAFFSNFYFKFLSRVGWEQMAVA